MISSISSRYSCSHVGTASSTDSSSTSFADVLSALAQGSSEEETSSTTATKSAATADATKVCLDTSRGKLAIDIDDYFTPRPGINFDDPNSAPPLLFPSADNIATLASHASEKFRQLLSEYDIPAAPDSIKYGFDGQMQLPGDYAYSDQLKAALDENPVLKRELSTVNALTSHYAGMQESLPFLQAYAAANSPAEIDQVVQQFSYLFDNNRAHAAIELVFSATGDLTPAINGRPIDDGVSAM